MPDAKRVKKGLHGHGVVHEDSDGDRDDDHHGHGGHSDDDDVASPPAPSTGLSVSSVVDVGVPTMDHQLHHVMDGVVHKMHAHVSHDLQG